MPSTTPNLSLISWTGSDKFDHGDLATNWSTIDTAYGDLLSKSGTDTISGNVTVSGSIRFGATDTIIFTQTTINDTVSYKGVEVGGTIYIEKPSAAETAFAVKLNADANADDSFRLKVRADGRVYWGDGSSHDVVLMRDAADSLSVQLDSDVETSNVTKVLASPELGKDYTSFGLVKQNFVWNPDFEVDNAGWAVGAYSTITNAASSISSVNVAGSGSLGTRMGEIVTPGGSANQGAHFPIFTRFAAGVQYNIRVRIYSGSSTTNVEAGIAGPGVIYAQSAATALSSTWQELSFSWTPGSSVNEAVVFVRIPGTTATTFSIDEVKVFVGSTPTFVSGFFPIAETMRRIDITQSNLAPVSNTQYVVALNVEKGMKVSQIGLMGGDTTGTSITAAAAGVYSVALATDTSPSARFTATRLAFTASMENFLYQGPYQPMVWTLSTPYRFTYTGVAYVSFVITSSGTMPTVAGRANQANMFGIRGYTSYPLLGTLGSGGSLPSSSAIGISAIGVPYAWIA